MTKKRRRPLRPGDTIKCADYEDMKNVERSLRTDGILTIIEKEYTLRITAIDPKADLNGYLTRKKRKKRA